MESNKKMLGYIGLGCNSLAFILAFIFSIVTCSRTATEKWKIDLDEGLKVKHIKYSLSYACIGCIIAAVFAIIGRVLTILSHEKGDKLSIITLISLVVGVLAILWAIIPMVTVCAHSCSVANALTKEMS